MRRTLSLGALLSVLACGSVKRPGTGDDDAAPVIDAAGGSFDGAAGDASPPDAGAAVFASCAEIRADDPDADDGPYTIDRGDGEIEVWCIMSGASTTYEALGFGSAFGAYADYIGVTGSNLQNARIQAAFLWLYNQQGGAINLDAGWNSGNCCFKGVGSPVMAMLTFGGYYLYPAEIEPAGSNCNSGYGSARYRFAMVMKGETLPPFPLPADFFASYPPGEATLCSDDNNPAWFFKRY